MCGLSKRVHFLRFRHQLRFVFQQRKHADFDRRHARMKSHDRACFRFAFFIRDRFFVERFANQSQHGAIDARARLDHMRHETLLRFLIEIIQRLAARVLMLGQIVIGAISDAFQFLFPKRKLVFDVESALRIKRAIRVRHIENMQRSRGMPMS